MIVDRQRPDPEDLPQLSPPVDLDKFTGRTLSKIDWSNSAAELVDTMPVPWTRGLLYCLLLFITIFLPWAFLYKMDEIGTARGRLEFQGDTIKREANIEGSVAVLKVHEIGRASCRERV